MWSMVFASQSMWTFAEGMGDTLFESKQSSTEWTEPQIDESSEEEKESGSDNHSQSGDSQETESIETTTTIPNSNDNNTDNAESVASEENDESSVDESDEPDSSTEFGPDTYYESKMSETDYPEEPEDDPVEPTESESVDSTDNSEDFTASQEESSDIVTETGSSEEGETSSVSSLLANPIESESTTLETAIETTTTTTATIAPEEDFATASETEKISDEEVATASEVENVLDDTETATASEADSVLLDKVSTNSIIIMEDIDLATQSEVVVFGADPTYPITWDLGDGKWSGTDGADNYTYDVEYVLPINVTPPLGKVLDHWEIGGVATTSIVKGTSGTVNVVAVYEDLPNIWYGVYPQNDTTGTQLEPIKWYLIQKDYDEILLISEKVLDAKCYDDAGSNVWANSSMREWLNNTFINNAFTTDQINNDIVNKILTTDGSTTYDRVFLLTKDEATDYFVNVDSRQAAGTAYFENLPGITKFTDGKREWWIRGSSETYSSAYANYITHNGNIITYDYYSYVENAGYGVRPAIYIKLDSASHAFKFSNNSITFDMGVYSFKTDSSLWNDFDNYQGGQQLPTNDNVTAPANYELKGWQLGSDPNNLVMQIPINQTGDITLTPIWKGIDYPITWDLGAGSFTIATPSQYEYSVGLTLPTATDMTLPVGQDLDYWIIRQAGEADIDHATSISTTTSGAVEVIAVYKNSKYDINWNLGAGSFTIATPSQYEYSVGLTLPTATDLTLPVGQDLDYWIIRQVGEADIDHATNISATTLGEVEVIAVYKNNQYPITWSLGTGNVSVVLQLEYEYSVGLTLPTAGDFILTDGIEFDYWILKQTGHADIDHVTEISTTQIDPVTVEAVYKNSSYNISWQLGTGINWRTGYIASTSYTYSVGLTLPSSTDLNIPAGRTFTGWTITQVGQPDITNATEISNTSVGGVTIIANYLNVKYGITWTLGAGSFTIATPSEYEYSVGLALPTATDMILPAGQELDYWLLEQSGHVSVVTSISTTQTGAVTLIAMYKTVTPADDDRNSSSSGGGGGSNSGGDAALINELPQDRLVVDTALISSLMAWNNSDVYYNAEDEKGNKGYGLWLRVPGTAIWYFMSDCAQFSKATGNIDATGAVMAGDVAIGSQMRGVGLIANGWFKLGWKGKSYWYHFDDSGKMQRGWYQENNKTYYLEEDLNSSWYGRKITGPYNIDGHVYNFDGNGVLIN